MGRGVEGPLIFVKLPGGTYFWQRKFLNSMRNPFSTRFGLFSKKKKGALILPASDIKTSAPMPINNEPFLINMWLIISVFIWNSGYLYSHLSDIIYNLQYFFCHLFQSKYIHFNENQNGYMTAYLWAKCSRQLSKQTLMCDILSHFYPSSTAMHDPNPSIICDIFFFSIVANRAHFFMDSLHLLSIYVFNVYMYTLVHVFCCV